MTEADRLKELVAFDRQYYAEGYLHIAGVDEAGRGPLAGPVVAAAVILPQNCEIAGIDDSKKLSEAKRERLFGEITEKAVAIGVGVCDEKIIDKINILQATFLAMKKSVDKLEISPDILLIDGNKVIPEHITGGVYPPQQAIIKGDGRSISIAAASIIAKVTRDRIMEEYDREYPQYGFAKHKGYPTKAHREAIEQFGVCEIHRRSFGLIEQRRCRPCKNNT